ncbi:MAG: hypothetical protein U5L46_10750 [Agrobacterium sp.]|nr:hypothetical protein [Agrobacterium sp.]
MSEGSFSYPVVIHGIIVHCGAIKIKIICLIQTIRFSLMMDLDLRQVRSFMDVADLGSFSAAADEGELACSRPSAASGTGKAASATRDRADKRARAASGTGEAIFSSMQDGSRKKWRMPSIPSRRIATG